MAHVGVERLGAGEDEHDGAEREERGQWMVGEELDGI